MILFIVFAVAIATILMFLIYYISLKTKHDEWMEKYQHDWIKFSVVALVTLISVIAGYVIGVGF